VLCESFSCETNTELLCLDFLGNHDVTSRVDFFFKYQLSWYDKISSSNSENIPISGQVVSRFDILLSLNGRGFLPISCKFTSINAIQWMQDVFR
jgi:hypothetical protein